MTQSPASVASGTVHVLYAEDDSLIRDLVAHFLQRSGYRVTACENGALALQQFLENPTAFQLIFTDYEMPALNGLNLVREMKTHGFTGAVLVNSGSLNPNIDASFAELGVTHFVAKPALPSELLKALRAALPQ